MEVDPLTPPHHPAPRRRRQKVGGMVIPDSAEEDHSKAK